MVMVWNGHRRGTDIGVEQTSLWRRHRCGVHIVVDETSLWNGLRCGTDIGGVTNIVVEQTSL